LLYNGFTAKIGEVVSTIPSEQITPAILEFAEADQNSLAIGFNVETVQVPLLYAEFGISGLHCAVNS
jgi:hypothetical protein